MTQARKLVTTVAFGAAVGVSSNIVRRLCDDYPGFGFRLRQRGRFYIPAEYIERMLRGESPAEIVAQVRAGGGQRAA